MGFQDTPLGLFYTTSCFESGKVYFVRTLCSETILMSEAMELEWFLKWGWGGMFSDLIPEAFLQRLALEATASCHFPSLAGSDTLSHRTRQGMLTQQIRTLVSRHWLQGLTAEGTQETGCSSLEKAGENPVSLQHICPDLNFDSIPVSFLSYLHCEHST